MTPAQQRIKIAEACGWDGIFKDDEGRYCGHQPNKPRYTEWIPNIPIPDYLSDLNAMHEAEKVLTDTNRYVACLRGLTDRLTNDFRFAHATAAQRAEAFLKTLNLWES